MYSLYIYSFSHTPAALLEYFIFGMLSLYFLYIFLKFFFSFFARCLCVFWFLWVVLALALALGSVFGRLILFMRRLWQPHNSVCEVTLICNWRCNCQCECGDVDVNVSSSCSKCNLIGSLRWLHLQWALFISTSKRMSRIATSIKFAMF